MSSIISVTSNMKYVTARTERNLFLVFQQVHYNVFCSIEASCSQLYHNCSIMVNVYLLLLILTNKFYLAFLQCAAINYFNHDLDDGDRK
jgi:hypothetical protein